MALNLNRKEFFMKFSSLALLACLAVSPVFAGGESGGGGGGICYNTGKCVTLAQAGLRLSSPQEQMKQEFDDKVVEYMGKISKKLSRDGLSNITKDVWGTDQTFVYVSEQDSAKFEEFKKDYVSILSQNGFDVSKLNLFAVSSARTTYILPAFASLDTQGKSLILIHEAAMREVGPKNLSSILEFDGILIDYLSGKKGVDAIDLAMAGEKIKLVKDGTGKILLMNKILLKAGGKMNLSSISEENSNGRYIKIDRIKAVGLKKYDQRAYSFLGGQPIYLEDALNYYPVNYPRIYGDQYYDRGETEFVKEACSGVKLDDTVLVPVDSRIEVSAGQPFITVECDYKG